MLYSLRTCRVGFPGGCIVDRESSAGSRCVRTEQELAVFDRIFCSITIRNVKKVLYADARSTPYAAAIYLFRTCERLSWRLIKVNKEIFAKSAETLLTKLFVVGRFACEKHIHASLAHVLGFWIFVFIPFKSSKVDMARRVWFRRTCTLHFYYKFFYVDILGKQLTDIPTKLFR